MVTGLAVFQGRQVGSEDFYHGWDDYVRGFGNLTGEFWLGLKKDTSTNKQKSQVDLADFEVGNTIYIY